MSEIKTEVMNSTIRKQILARAKRNLRKRDKLMTDVNVEENAEVTRDDKGYIVETDTLTFTTPEDSVKEDAKPGAKYDKPFTYRVVEDEEQAKALIAEKGEKWSLVELVNRKLKADARSNAYQTEVLTHKPLSSTVSVDEIKERLVKDFMRAGEGRITESMARAQVDAFLSQSNG